MLGVTTDTVRDYQLPPADRHIQTSGDPMPVWYRTTIKRWHATRNRQTLRKTAQYSAKE